MATEREALVGSLEMQRTGVLRIVKALPRSALRSSVVPTGWTPLGMLQHLTLNERYWFRWGVAGEELPGVDIVDGHCRIVLDDMPNPDDEWTVAPHLTPETVIDRYRTEIERANAAITAAGLEDPPRHYDGWWTGSGTASSVSAGSCCT